ncbi:sigma-70 family RNA polymerase sigma factor [Sphingomonas crocodyli]|uniref:sigma-70 family RNA polymerase sigma factor n=1 Tax=Sphingomonas crocodyli TaxID=1979270 RepID=UPI001F0C4EEA|nr:sigma-70 family RNA polymerase sigma factor [Sphingomonas crocodyli]
MTAGIGSAELGVLLLATADGDRAAFAELYRRTSAKLFGIVLRILPERSVAEDAMQDIYVKIWRNAAGYDAMRGSPIAWLATIARNVAIDVRRRERPGSKISTDEFDFDLLADEGTPSPEALAALRVCLERLDEDQRQLVLAAYLRGDSRDELAERLGHPSGTIKSWLHRALGKLKGCLGG